MKTTGLVAEMVAEFLGTALILMFGSGVCAMVVLFAKGAPGEIVFGGYTNIILGWAIGVVMGIYVSVRTSGAHLNPAVTLAAAVFRGFPWCKLAPYMLAQTMGGFAGAAVVFWNYRPAFASFDPRLEKTAGIFTTFPLYPDLPAAGFLDQAIGTALLLLLVFAITDDRAGLPAWLTPLLIGLVVVGIGASFGALHGYAINPARDLGPRLFTVLAGFQKNGLTDGTGAFWVPIAGPLAGGVIGAGLYTLAFPRRG